MRVYSRAIRITALLALLALEVVLIVSLRAQGWDATGSSIRWLTSMLAVLLPLLIAFVLLFRKGLRFDLRTLFIVTSLVAVFLTIAMLPLLDAYRARRASRRLLASGAELYTAASRKVNSYDRWYGGLGYDPRGDGASVGREDDRLPPWLTPLAGDLLTIPTARSITRVDLASDAQIQELCASPASFPNVTHIYILGSGVTLWGMETLRNALPQFERVVEITVIHGPIPRGWLESLEGVKALYLVVHRPATPRHKLTDEDLAALGTLPDLRILTINGYPITDSDIKLIAQSKSLRYLFLQRTAVTQDGKRELEQAMPECSVDLR